VVAGVVGVKKFAYDIWGDTVNIASRVEANGQVGRVNISETTYNLIKYDFDCEYRGKVEAKNKGLLDMYFVNREKIAAAVA
jgi:class 3 adenylate cyclase